ncbi:MAG TPA: hypothetical protein VK922_15435 [Gemmatimonadaceae bacterium]|nr:hypothetical protein [Gemmatimonadaceae bacterium]
MPEVRECERPAGEWIWCDDFEEDRAASYFEIQRAGGRFTRDAGVGIGGSSAMQARFAAGQAVAGSLHLAFGRTPDAYFKPVDEGTRDYREIYWRVWVRTDSAWTGGGGYKLSRGTVFADARWAQAMIAHVWAGEGARNQYLVLDPATGTDGGGVVRTRKYNDFERLRFIGSQRGRTAVFGRERIGRWQCIEAGVVLNDPGRANGRFVLWVDGVEDARRENLNWLGTYAAFGLNAVMLENYWNGGAPTAQSRYFDNFVVSTARIGCGAAD